MGHSRLSLSFQTFSVILDFPGHSGLSWSMVFQDFSGIFRLLGLSSLGHLGIDLSGIAHSSIRKTLFGIFGHPNREVSTTQDPDLVYKRFYHSSLFGYFRLELPKLSLSKLYHLSNFPGLYFPGNFVVYCQYEHV
jgi:hypothetical protein